MVWECSVLRKYWTKVLNKLDLILEVKLPRTPQVCLLDIGLKELLTQHLSVFTRECLFLEKKAITRRLKVSTPPKYSHWLSEVKHLCTLESLIYKTRGAPKKHEKIWGKWLENGSLKRAIGGIFLKHFKIICL
ncbi:hypothetical protein XENTR_v10018942 [Xenopus tropicalis]|nr:hypothetical protein XENTR_v10018942 [Xenopus tropicalis]